MTELSEERIAELRRVVPQACTGTDCPRCRASGTLDALIAERGLPMWQRDAVIADDAMTDLVNLRADVAQLRLDRDSDAHAYALLEEQRIEWMLRAETAEESLAALRAENALLRAKIEGASPLHNERLRSAMMIVEQYLLARAGATVVSMEQDVRDRIDIADPRLRAAWNVITGTASDALDALKEQR